jgi:phage terminase large subunit
MKGVILTGWDTVPEVPENITFIGYGLDFGFANDPAALVAIWGNKQEIWIEGLLYSTGLSNNELYDKILESGAEEFDKIIGDSAEPKTIDELYKLGLKGIKGAKKKPNYKAEMANVLKGMTIHLVDGDTDLQRDFQTWSWDEDKTGKLLPRPKDGNDHYMDATIMLMHDYRGPVAPISFIRG